MIDKAKVKELVDQWLDGKDYFLTDLTVTPDNCITVEIDHADGVWIDDCVQLSRHIEENLSRDEEDYELEVGSAGLGQPFMVFGTDPDCDRMGVAVRDSQGVFHTLTGNQIGCLLLSHILESRKLKGILREADAEHVLLATRQKVQVEGRKRPVMQDVDVSLPMAEVKSGRYIIDFK